MVWEPGTPLITLPFTFSGRTSCVFPGGRQQRRAWRQASEFGEAAAIERKFDDLRIADHLTERTGLGGEKGASVVTWTCVVVRRGEGRDRRGPPFQPSVRYRRAR